MHRPVLIAALIAALLCACNLVNQPISPTPAIPTVSFQFPANNVSVAEGTDLQIQLLAQDSVGVAHVELRVDDQAHEDAKPVEATAVPIFTVDMNWLAKGVGLHSLQATAFRLDGTASTPILINVNVTSAQKTQEPEQTQTLSPG
jgi:Bacterial Ig domain